MKDENKDSEVLVTQIPLKVKKAKAPKKIDKPKKKKNTKIELPVLKEDKLSLQFLSTIKGVSVIVLLIISIVLIGNIVLEIDKNKESIVIPENEKNTIENDSILGNWITENNSLFRFDKDGNFYWYDSVEDLHNNYYGGTYTYKKGLDALSEMGYTEEEVKVTFGDEIDIENIYSIIMQPTTLIKGQKDQSAKELKERETWWFLIIKKNDKEALGYNKTLDLRYNLTSY